MLFCENIENIVMDGSCVISLISSLFNNVLQFDVQEIQCFNSDESNMLCTCIFLLQSIMLDSCGSILRGDVHFFKLPNLSGILTNFLKTGQLSKTIFKNRSIIQDDY